MRRIDRFLGVCCIALLSFRAEAADPAFAIVRGTTFASVLPTKPGVDRVQLASFAMQRTPVTNADYARFIAQHPRWRRGRVPATFADAGYLRAWPSDTQPNKHALRQPVVQVSWFAATAYCDSIGARLPRWHEWEWAAAADSKRMDARQDPAWRQHILNWYARTGDTLGDVAAHPPDVRGIYDLNGLVWEWVEDQSALMVSGDNREQGDPDVMRFCGSGALTMEQKENYAVLMRIAMLSSMEARYTTTNMGFRCVRDLPSESRP